MNVTAIIVNYFSLGFLPQLLDVLDAEGCIKEIIVADNSHEEGLERLVNRFNKVRALTMPGNVGFGCAVNTAAQHCTTDWFLVINPDTLPEKGCIEKLIQGAEKADAAIAGPRFYWDDQQTFRLPPALGYSWWVHAGMESAGRNALDSTLFSFYWNLRFDRFWKQEVPFFEPFLVGACMLIKNDGRFFKKGKIFDESYFLYYEDTDLCVKVLNKKLNIVCVPDATVIHYWDQTPSSEKPRRMQESHEIFRKKNVRFQYPAIDDSTWKPDDITDLGLLREPPVFRFNEQNDDRQNYIEIGLNPFFVPFSQADVKGETFKFPQAVWERMAPGTYYTRLREPEMNASLKLWKWKKG